MHTWWSENNKATHLNDNDCPLGLLGLLMIVIWLSYDCPLGWHPFPISPSSLIWWNDAGCGILPTCLRLHPGVPGQTFAKRTLPQVPRCRIIWSLGTFAFDLIGFFPSDKCLWYDWHGYLLVFTAIQIVQVCSSAPGLSKSLEHGLEKSVPSEHFHLTHLKPMMFGWFPSEFPS